MERRKDEVQFKKVKTKIRRILALGLAIAMVFSGDVTAFAEDAQNGDVNSPITHVTVVKPTVQSGEVENIVVGMDNNLIVSDAELLVKNQDTDIDYILDAGTITEETILFEQDFIDSGKYQVMTFMYDQNGEKVQINLNDIGIEAVFGVNTQIEADPDAYVTDESDEISLSKTSDVQMDIATIDEEGNAVSQNSVADAIASAQSEVTTRSAAKDGNSNVIVVLDPGHGGKDNGASRTYNGITYYEKTLNLKIALACREELQKYAGVKVYMTRSDDTYVELLDRTAYGKEVGATVLVSIHNNSADNTSANGAQVYFPSNNYNSTIGTQGNQLANQVMAQLVNLGLKDSGCKVRYSDDPDFDDYKYPDGSISDYYNIIRNSKKQGFPGIIIEHAFLSNSSDTANFLSDDNKLRALGVADATGIANYFGLHKTVYNGLDYTAVFDADYYLSANPDVRNVCGSNVEAAFQHFINHGMQEGRQGREEFNVNYYKEHNTDIQKVYGDNTPSYYTHFIKYGLAEGRSGAAVYNVYSYRGRYPYLYEKYGDDLEAYYWDYLNDGKEEGRNASEVTDAYKVNFSYNNQIVSTQSVVFGHSATLPQISIPEGATALYDKDTHVITGNTDITITTGYVLDNVNYSPVFEPEYYLNKYPDLQNAFGNDANKALEHFVHHGMYEGRQGSENFDVYSYRARYDDVSNSYGDDLAKYYMHYINYGQYEGRDGTKEEVYYTVTFMDEGVVKKTQKVELGHSASAPSITKSGATLSWDSSFTNVMSDITVNAVWKYIKNGVDYTAVFNADSYLNRYSDLKQTFGTDGLKALNHFVNHGMSEGRQGNDTFSVKSYKNLYPDLRNAYGTDLIKYYLHYINNGKKEGRTSIGYDNTVVGATTIYDGVNYSAVYDFNTYIDKYPDIYRAFGMDEQAVLSHFVNHGMSEGRQGSNSFSVVSYKNQYPDLRNAYGTDLRKYYLHYVYNGKNEGRKATGSETTVVGATTVYNGVNYSAVYDYNYYITNNPDLFRAFGYNDAAALSHFVNYGMYEGRQASKEFNQSIYKNRYSDLSSIYGNDKEKYYLHYIYYGKQEGRAAA